MPGTVTPLRSAHIYARASGYLKARYVDLGDKVRKGQLLGMISAPDLDASVAQQAAAVQQSRDSVLTAQSTLRLQQATYDRVHTLVLHGILSQQDDDAARAALESAQSNLQAMENAVKGAQAALARAQALADFEQVRSPINGTITARNVEVGNLVSASGSRTGPGACPRPAPRAGRPPAARRAANCFMSWISAAWRYLCLCRSRMRLSCRPASLWTSPFQSCPERRSRARWFGAATLSASRPERCSPRYRSATPSTGCGRACSLRCRCITGPRIRASLISGDSLHNDGARSVCARGGEQCHPDAAGARRTRPGYAGVHHGWTAGRRPRRGEPQ